MKMKHQQQLELFKNIKTLPLSPSKRKSYLKQGQSYNQRDLVILIIFVFGIILSYSIGVEKGKSLNNKLLTQNVVKIKKQPSLVLAQKIPEVKYTVQVATYKKSSYAQKEKNNLSKKGFQVFILTKGNLLQLCVGTFSAKEEAKKYLQRLKKYYPDCFLRRL